MPTWSELEARFQALESPMRFARLDKQSGTDGESWRIAALADLVTRSKFESLSRLAGRKLLATPMQPPEVLSAEDDLVRWYRRLSFNSPHFQFGLFGHVKDDDGTNVGWVSTGSVDRPAEVSAAMCLELHAMTNEPSDSLPSGLTINLSGANSRLNLGSTDNSTNSVSTAVSAQVFADVRRTIEQSVTGGERQSLLARLDALEAAKGQPSFNDRYKDFIQAAANHLTILAPFIPAITDLLK